MIEEGGRGGQQQELEKAMRFCVSMKSRYSREIMNLLKDQLVLENSCEGGGGACQKADRKEERTEEKKKKSINDGRKELRYMVFVKFKLPFFRYLIILPSHSFTT